MLDSKDILKNFGEFRLVGGASFGRHATVVQALKPPLLKIGVTVPFTLDDYWFQQPCFCGRVSTDLIYAWVSKF